MKRLFYFLAAFAATALPAHAADLVRYATAYGHQGALYQQTDPPVFVSADPTFQAADCTLIRDGAVAETCDNTPVWETNGVFSWTMSATEATADTITLILSDDSATAFLDYSQTFSTYDSASAEHTTLGANMTWDELIETAGVTDYSARDILCVLLAEAAGRADYVTGTSTWTVADPSNTQTRLTLVYGTDDGDRNSSTLAVATDC